MTAVVWCKLDKTPHLADDLVVGVHFPSKTYTESLRLSNVPGRIFRRLTMGLWVPNFYLQKALWHTVHFLDLERRKLNQLTTKG